MATSSLIHRGRVAFLNSGQARAGDFVLYWMQQAQRASGNHALEYAVERANELDQPLLVCFGITDSYPEANLRHYTFMLEGLRAVGRALEKRGIGFELHHGDPAEVALRLSKKASLLVCDRGYLRVQKEWRKRVAREAPCGVVQVESDVVVPVDVASDRREFAARTLRPKLTRLLPEYLEEVPTIRLKQKSVTLARGDLDWRKPEPILGKLKLDRSVAAVSEFFKGGTDEAERLFRRFCQDSLDNYERTRNQPQTNNVSHMSKYLHFGQISPVWLALEVRKHDAASENVRSFMDELIVRRELSMNWVEQAREYDRFEALPEWARKTLQKHARDRREHVYSRAELESSATHDPYWNAAMTEMRTTGYMHNYMRMYWGKKILEWSESPEAAHATALAINNKYFLDGRDANSFANVAWIFGQHDRPWPERPIFGKVRYMNAAGLERKCDIRAYVEKVHALEQEEN